MSHQAILSYISWNPDREAFTLPFIELSVMWYGVLFALGFIAGYFILIPVATQYFKEKLSLKQEQANNLAYHFSDRLVWYVVLGTLIGARLGHVFFYDWDYYQAYPLEILMLRKGGLASHGGTIGVLAALFVFYKFNKKNYGNLSFVTLVDMISIPTAVTVCFIRIGNFINQEIVGIESSLPWAVLFENPSEGVIAVPRHPAQLYEAAVYLTTFFVLFPLWKRYCTKLKPGIISGLFFISIFGSRFFIEFIKLPYTTQPGEHLLNTAQYLSLPFVAFGIALLLWPQKINSLSIGEKK